MLKILERRITLQLLVFFGLFIIPLLLGGVELYLFQRDALQQSAQRTDLGIAQAIALEVESNIQAAVEEDVDLSNIQAASQLNLAQLHSIFATARLSHPGISLYFVCDAAGHMLLSYPANQGLGGQQDGACEYIPAPGALQNDTPLLSTGRVSPTTRTQVVSITTPIIDDRGHLAGIMGIDVSLDQFTSHLVQVQRQLTTNGEVHIWVVDEAGKPLASTDRVSFQTDLRAALPGLQRALAGKQGNLIARSQNRDWLYSYLPIAGTRWAVVVQRPTDVTFAAIISFQNSLLIALVTLLIGASFFWFVLHGWVVRPLSKLAQAVSMIRPDQMEKVTEGDLLAKDRHRIDEIGQLITAFSTMEDEIHVLFRKSDERSQARLQTLDAIMRSMDEGVLLERPDGHIIYANQRFTQFVGVSRQDLLQEDSFDEQLVEEKLLALMENPGAYHEAIRRAEIDNDPSTVEFQVRGSYNQVGQLVPARHDIRMRLFQVRDQDGQLIGRGKIFRDVTRQNEAEQIKQNLLAIVSHELRTPLTAMKGYATSLLETDVELDEALQRHFLQRIVEEGDRMAELVTGMLEMSQLEAGTLKLTPSLHRLDALIEQVVPAEERGSISVQVPPDMPLLYVDGRRIEVVLRNLVENARRYAGNDALIEISARYEQGPTDGGLYLSVADSGPGLPPHLTERIFDRFYQVDGGRQRSRSGVGLGLAICRGFVETHGGRIWAENRGDGVTGAVFHTWLPPKILYTGDAEPSAFELGNVL
jgi:PAS domain S-box-containing protein